MGRASFNIFNELNESFAEEVKKMQTPKKSLKERQAARKRNLIKEEAKVRGQKRYASLKENDWTVTYIPDPTKKDQTATISVSAVNKSEAVNKARQTIGQDCPITLVQPLQETDNGLKEDDKLKEDEVIQIPITDQEPDYIIEDVTELTVVGDGDIQAPDIEGLLTLVDESLRTTYGDKWGHIRILSSNKMNENACYALVDISTPEIIKEFESRGIEDAAVGKNLILESSLSSDADNILLKKPIILQSVNILLLISFVYPIC